MHSVLASARVECIIKRGSKIFEKFQTYSFGLVFFLLCQLDSVLEVALSWHLFQGGPLHQASIFSDVTDFGSR